jgi:hypothetical protein
MYPLLFTLKEVTIFATTLHLHAKRLEAPKEFHQLHLTYIFSKNKSETNLEYGPLETLLEC